MPVLKVHEASGALQPRDGFSFLTGLFQLSSQRTVNSHRGDLLFKAGDITHDSSAQRLYLTPSPAEQEQPGKLWGSGQEQGCGWDV